MIHRVVWIFSHDSSAGTEERVSIWALRVPETWRTWRKSPKKKERTDLWFALGHWLLLVPVLVPCFFILCYFIQQTIWTVWIYHIWIVFSAMESQMLHVIMCFYEVFFFREKPCLGQRVEGLQNHTEPICCRRRCHTEDFHGTLLADSNLCGSLSGWMKACGPQGILKKVTFHQRARRLRDSA